MKYRPSKSFVFLMVTLCPLAVALVLGLLPELERFRNPPIPGMITFESETRPAFTASRVVKKETPVISGESNGIWKSGLALLDQLNLNPWKKVDGFGAHYYKLCGSADPVDQQRVKELKRLAQEWYERLMLRYPELAVTPRTVPDEKNGFLKWLEFSERFKQGKVFEFPPELKAYLDEDSGWDPASAGSWLASQKALMDEIRAIGSMTDRSTTGIDPDRYFFLSAQVTLSCVQAFELEAQVRASEGNTLGAMESIRAAKGLVDHLVDIETPSLLGISVHLLTQRRLEKRTIEHLIPSLPAGSVDYSAWESILNPRIQTPAEFARIMAGEWSLGSRAHLLPVLLDGEEKHPVPDAGALLDVYSSQFAEIRRDYDKLTVTDLGNLPSIREVDRSHLSEKSKTMTELLTVGIQGWSKGWQTQQARSGMTLAAFSILKGEPVPHDPISGKAYEWDATTRTLSMPLDARYEKMEIKPMKVPGR